MKCDKRDLLLYGVTDRSWSEGTTLGAQVEDLSERMAAVRPAVSRVTIEMAD